LLRFSLTSTGRVTGLSEVPQSVMPVLDQVSLAVSADGTWAAIAGLPQTDRRWRHDVGADPPQGEGRREGPFVASLAMDGTRYLLLEEDYGELLGSIKDGNNSQFHPLGHVRSGASQSATW
jgi:hypothetical protein